jgi:hypothetical protein
MEFVVKPSTLGPEHQDFQCPIKGCSWHKVIYIPTAGDKAIADLREHLTDHRAVA